MENDLILQKTKLVILGYLTKELWEEGIALNEPNLDFSLHTAGMLSNEIVMRLSCKYFTYGEGEYQFEWYKSWWQELREKILPRWWIERHPSLMETKKIVKCMATYPSIKIGDIDHKAIMKFV